MEADVRPVTRYAKSGDVHVAYQVLGDGPTDLVVVHGFTSHLELFWEWPIYARFFERLAGVARVVLFDKRGIGLSDRSADVPTLEDRMDDVRVVMDAVGSRRAVLLGVSEGAPLSLLFAATLPDRVSGLVLHGGMARCTEDVDYPFAPPRQALVDAAVELIAPAWDEPATIEVFAPSLADDPVERARWVRLSHAAASPAAATALYTMALDTDVRHVLPAIQVPTLVLHRRGDRAVSVHGARWMARQIPGSRYVELDGVDHFPWIGDQDAVLGEIEEFLTGVRHVTRPDRALLTVMVTDIVASTRTAVELGDAGWREVLARHTLAVDQQIDRYGGTLRNTTGDGVIATFDGPTRAIRAATAIRDAVSDLGIELRIGLHCGECELVDGDVAGIAVHIAARVAGVAEGGQIVASRTVRDLVAGSGIAWEDLGAHPLKGVDDAWRLFAVDHGHEHSVEDGRPSRSTEART